MLTFRGSKVFETRPFDIDFINELDLLSRERQCGEYFIMKDKNIRSSMDEDDFVEIDYATAKAAADAAGANVTNKDYIVLVRPFQTYLKPCILMKGGLDTGMTAYGHMDFQLTVVISKTHIGHFTMYHKSIVKQPKNVAIVEDIFSQRYVRGEGTEIYASPQEFKDDLAEDRFKKDILAFWVGEEKKRAAVENPIDLTGYYDAETLDASTRISMLKRRTTRAMLWPRTTGLEAFARTATRTATSYRLCVNSARSASRHAAGSGCG